MFGLRVAESGKVAVLCKSDPTEGSTRYAQGGIASVTGPLDSFEAHIDDTLKAGAGLCDVKVVELVVREGPDRIRDLISLGTRFDSQKGSYTLGREGGHSERRILHAKDETGAEIQRALLSAALKHPNITIYPNHIAIDLIREDDDVLGCYAYDPAEGKVDTFSAKKIMLATGGAGKVYLYTSNPDVATGDGIAMAYRAGADIGNMEFFQFHPTCLYHPEAKSFLLSEALRGEGAILKNLSGEAFMSRYHPLGDLAPRDIVARAIDSEMKSSGADYVYLDISHKPRSFLEDRFPNILNQTRRFGFDMTQEPVPVVPAAHYCCGGVCSDEFGRTTLKNLYVAGEAAYTGLHGANRLASNSLLEAVVFANRAAQQCLDTRPATHRAADVPPWDYLGSVASDEKVFVSHAWDEVRRVMWNFVGIVRSDKRLIRAQHRISLVKSEIRDYYWKYQPTSDLIELRNIVDIADLIVRSALLRKESRGLHYTTDYPNPLSQAKATIIRKESE